MEALHRDALRALSEFSVFSGLYTGFQRVLTDGADQDLFLSSAAHDALDDVEIVWSDRVYGVALQGFRFGLLGALRALTVLGLPKIMAGFVEIFEFPPLTNRGVIRYPVRSENFIPSRNEGNMPFRTPWQRAAVWCKAVWRGLASHPGV